MKKTLYVLLAIILIGGVAFGLSQSNLLKGDFTAETLDEEGSSGGDGDDGFGDLEDGDEDDDDDGDFLPGNFGPGPGFDPGPGTPDPGCDSEYYLNIWIETEDGTNLNISESKFTIETTGGYDVTNSFDFNNEGSGEYTFDYNSTGTPSEYYNIIVNPNGYQEGEVESMTNDTCSDYRSGSYLEVFYNHTITVKDHNGDYITDADVSTGTSYGTDCDYWSDENKYLCPTPDSGTEQYRVEYTGYVSKEGTFSSVSKSKTESYDYGKASLLAAESSHTYEGSYEFATSGSDIRYEYEYGYGLSSDHKTVTLNEFAWTITVEDADTDAVITNANVEITPYGENTTDCTYQSDEQLYWCSETSHHSASDGPSYTVSASGYDTVNGQYLVNRGERTTHEINEVVALSQTVTIDTASYCDDITISSSDLPVAADATELGDIEIDVVISATNSDYEDSFEIYSGASNSGELINSDGDSDTEHTADITGTSTTLSYTYTGGTVGESIMAFTNGGYCSSATIEMTQEEAEPEPEDEGDDEEEPSDEYELSCSDVNISPDSYEIYTEATSSTFHQFTLEWTVIEQLIAIKHAPEWIKRSFAYKHDLNPSIMLSEETDDSITLTIATTGSGSLFLDDLSTAYTSIDISIAAEETASQTFYYQGAEGGDTLYVTSSDNNCSDSLSLTEEVEEEVEEEEPEDVVDFEEIADVDECEEYFFTDVDPNDEMSTYIFCLAQTGAVQGYADGSGRYGPSYYMTNAELIKVIVSMTGQPLVSSNTETEFLDIENHWGETYIKTGEYLDIVRPRESIYFNPDIYATRGYLTVLLARAAGQTLWGWDDTDIPFTDVSTSDYYAYATILASQAIGDVPGMGEEYIIYGYSDGTFRGENYIQRDEAAAMLIRAFYAWFN